MHALVVKDGARSDQKNDYHAIQNPQEICYVHKNWGSFNQNVQNFPPLENDQGVVFANRYQASSRYSKPWVAPQAKEREWKKSWNRKKQAHPQKCVNSASSQDPNLQ